MPETTEALLVLALAVLPGALHWWAVEREIGKWGVGLSDRLLRFFGTTAVYQAAFAYPLYVTWSRFVHHRVIADGQVTYVNEIRSGTAPGWIWLLPILYVGVPIAIGTMAGRAYQGREWLSRLLLGRDPAPTSWEFLFSHRPEGVIRARLKSDGRWVGGLFGPNSYAAGYREDPQDILIERAYRLLEDGTFAEGESEGEYEEIGSALLIRWDELDHMEFFPTGNR